MPACINHSRQEQTSSAAWPKCFRALGLWLHVVGVAWSSRGTNTSQEKPGDPLPDLSVWQRASNDFCDAFVFYELI